MASGGGKHSHEHSQSASSNDSKAALFLGAGEVRRINQKLGKVTLKHGPIGSEMPAMTMEFPVIDPKLLEGIKKGQKFSFTINNDMVIIDGKINGQFGELIWSQKL